MGCVRAYCDLRSVVTCPKLLVRGLRHPIEDAGLLVCRSKHDRRQATWRSTAEPTRQTWSRALDEPTEYQAEFYAVLDGAGPAYQDPEQLAELVDNPNRRSLGEQMVEELNHHLYGVAEKIISSDQDDRAADGDWFTCIWQALLQRYAELDAQFFDAQPWRQRTTVCLALAGYRKGRHVSQEETQLFFANLGDAMVGIQVDGAWYSTSNTVAWISRRVTDERRACDATMSDLGLWREHFYSHDHSGHLCVNECRSWLSSEEMRSILANSPNGYTCLGPRCEKIQVHQVPLTSVNELIVATDGALHRDRLIATELNPSALFAPLVEPNPACPGQRLDRGSNTEATLIYRQF